MARFVEGDRLNAALIDLIRNADDYLFLISPYIKLHQRIKDALSQKRMLPDLEIVVVFGKSENGKSATMSADDIDFFREFPNVEIRHKENLHAKFYASEDGALITSLNLYDFSQNTNIEAGIWMETPNTLLGRFTGLGSDRELEADAFNFFLDVIKNSELLYKKAPKVEERLMGFGKRYLESRVEVDKLLQFFNTTSNYKQSFSGFKSFDKKNNYQSESPKPTGYCIRTGASIPFNTERPFCYDAYQSWSGFENWDFKERYCHFSGEPSNGETSYRYPILKKNWKKSKEVWG